MADDTLSDEESGVTNLDVNIFCFALFALFVSPPHFRLFAQWVRQRRDTTEHRAQDAFAAATSLLLFGLFYPFYFLSQIRDEIANPSRVQPAPLWADGIAAFVVVLFLLIAGLRLRRVVRFMRAPRHRPE